MNAPEPVNAVVLAGHRDAADPVAEHAGVPSKVLAPIAGKSMIDHVLHTLAGLQELDGLVLVAPELTAGRVPAAIRRNFKRFEVLEPAPGPSASVAAALARLPEREAVILVTADHPLLRREWLETLRETAGRTRADVAVAVVDFERFRERFPLGRRTRYRFADREICGTNLYFFRCGPGRRLADQWARVEAHRKRPWRVIRFLGAWNLARYLTGRMTVEQGFDALSDRLGMRIVPVMLEAAESAVDVDSVDDLLLVRQLLEARCAESAGSDHGPD